MNGRTRNSIYIIPTRLFMTIADYVYPSQPL
jgi:hypothetical protein